MSQSKNGPLVVYTFNINHFVKWSAGGLYLKYKSFCKMVRWWSIPLI